MRNFILAAVILLVGLFDLSAQTKSVEKSPALEEASPESVGVSPERLARIDQMCEEAVKEENLPGMVTLMVRNGKIILWKAYGMAENEKGRKMKRDDIFRRRLAKGRAYLKIIRRNA